MKKVLRSAKAAVLFFVFSSGAASAQAGDSTSFSTAVAPSNQLKGAVKYDSETADSPLRILRHRPAASNYAWPANNTTSSTADSALQDLSSGFAPAPPGNFAPERKAAQKVLSGNTAQAALSSEAKASAQKTKVPCMWQLSRMGGYYDVTQQVQGVIPGDQLWRYGGNFADGPPVPRYPVATNFGRHVLHAGQYR